LYRSKSYFSGRNLAKFQKKITLHLRCLLSSWMNDNCAEVYGFVTGVSISSRAALKVRVPGSASTLCRPLIPITELPSGFTPCPPHIKHCQIFCSIFWDYVIKKNVTTVHFEAISRAFHFSKCTVTFFN
jgi:hypothetical protein